VTAEIISLLRERRVLSSEFDRSRGLVFFVLIEPSQVTRILQSGGFEGGVYSVRVSSDTYDPGDDAPDTWLIIQASLTHEDVRYAYHPTRVGCCDLDGRPDEILLTSEESEARGYAATWSVLSGHLNATKLAMAVVSSDQLNSVRKELGG
jgi:hypothetical protein